MGTFSTVMEDLNVGTSETSNQNIDQQSLYGHGSAHFDDVTIKILIYQYLYSFPAVSPTDLTNQLLKDDA